MNRDVYLNKRQSILACLARIHDKVRDTPNPLADLDRKEIVLLNLQRACELAIDLAMHAVAEQSLGIPQDSRDAFRLLTRAGHLSADLGERMQHMVGFRNVAVHQYQTIDNAVVQRILDSHLGEFVAFLDALRPPAR